MKFTDNQKKVLNLLLDKYERSRTYQGTNSQKQHFYLTPATVWKEYDSDYADIDRVRDFEEEMTGLSEEGLVDLQYLYHVISRIYLKEDGIPDCYRLLNRRDRNSVIEEQKQFFREWMEKEIPIAEEFCKEQIRRLSEGKKPQYDMEISEGILSILSYIHTNQKEIMWRELSLLLFSDSKIFETRYKGKICKVIETYGTVPDGLKEETDQKEYEKFLLEEYHIFANPSYIYVKGNGTLRFSDGTVVESGMEPVAFSSMKLSGLSSIEVRDRRIVTVENLTSFHRISEKNCFYIYLAGYHNSEKQIFLRKMSAELSDKEWYHFGDPDPDGFYILENLKRGTGIPFKPLYMGIEELEQFKEASKVLNENDRKKAASLIEAGLHKEVLSYMLEKNRKLEQEMISFYHSTQNKISQRS